MQLADLAVEQRGDVCVLVCLDPVLVLAQIIGHGRVDDGNVLAVDRRGLELLQRRHGLVYLGRRQLGRGVHACAAVNGGVRARSADLVAVLHARARCQRVADELVLRGARRCAQLLGRAEDHVVNGVQLQLVGHSDVGTVLDDGACHARLAQLLARGNHALGQCRRVRKRVPLAPFDLLAPALRQRLLSGELRVNEVRTRIFQQLRVIVCLHQRRQVVGRCERGGRAVVSIYIVLRGVDQRTGVRCAATMHEFQKINFHLAPFPGLTLKR